MSSVHVLSIFILENTGYSLTFETSHFLNGSIHHSERVSGGELSKSFTFSKCHQNSKPWICSRGWPVVYISKSLKAQRNHRGAGKHDPRVLRAPLQSHLLLYMPCMKSNHRLFLHGFSHCSLLSPCCNNSPCPASACLFWGTMFTGTSFKSLLSDCCIVGEIRSFCYPFF